MNTGKLIIVSAPSGSGKSTLVNYLMQQGLDLAFSVSCTSRAPRGEEKHGVEYYFLTPEEFRQRIANDELVEYEEVYTDKFYGTLKSQVENQLEEGQNIVFDVDVKRFIPQRHEDKVPQMGWNTIEQTKSQLFQDFDKPEFVYFIHSFYAPLCQHTIATTNYIHPYSSALHKDNFYATQFHPEKSGSVGERILRNFIDL